MRVDERVSFVANFQAAEIAVTTIAGRLITIRANDIIAVEEQLADVRSEIYTGARSRIHFNRTTVDVRLSAAAVIALINATVPALAFTAVYVQDQKADGTNGGAGVAGAFQTRDLTTITADPGNLATLVSNQLTLVAGTYLTLIMVPAVEVNGFQSRLQNITAGTTTILGTNGHTGRDDVQTWSFIQGRFVIAVTTTFEVQMRQASTPVPNNSFGLATGFAGTEIYTTARFFRIQE